MSEATRFCPLRSAVALGHRRRHRGAAAGLGCTDEALPVANQVY